MTRSRHRTAGAAFIALFATFLLAASTVAGGFTATTTLHTATANVPILASDIATRGKIMVVGWTEFHDGDPATYVRTSTDGATFPGPTIRLDSSDPQQNIQLAICGGWWWAVTQTNLPGDENNGYSIYMQGRSLDGTGAEDGPILAESFTTLYTQSPGIACVGDRRTAVAWLEKNGYSAAHAKVAIDPLASRVGGIATDRGADLGKARLDGGLAVAASTDTTFVGWFRGSAFRLRRFSVGKGPRYIVTPHPAATLFDASTGHDPVLAVDGSTVVLTFTEAEDQWVRISTDGGLVFGAPHRLLNLAPTDSATVYARSADVRGSRIAIEATEIDGPGLTSSVEYRFESADLGHTWTRTTAAHGGERVGAFTVVGGVTKLAEAWDERNTDATHQWLRFHREV